MQVDIFSIGRHYLHNNGWINHRITFPWLDCTCVRCVDKTLDIETIICPLSRRITLAGHYTGSGSVSPLVQHPAYIRLIVTWMPPTQEKSEQRQHYCFVSLFVIDVSVEKSSITVERACVWDENHARNSKQTSITITVYLQYLYLKTKVISQSKLEK